MSKITLRQLKKLIEESSERFPDAVLRADLEALKKRGSFPNGFVHLSRAPEQFKKYYDPDASFQAYDKKKLANRILGLLQENRSEKASFTDDDCLDFLLMFSKGTLKKPDYLPERLSVELEKEPIEFVEYLAKEYTELNEYSKHQIEKFLSDKAISKSESEKVEEVKRLVGPQLVDYHDSMIGAAKGKYARRYDLDKAEYEKLTGPEDMLSKWELENRTERIRRTKYTTTTNREDFIEENSEPYEVAFQEALEDLAHYILKNGLDPARLRVVDISSDYTKSFRVQLSDGIRILDARSILAAEFSSMVRPHFRFLATVRKI